MLKPSIVAVATCVLVLGSCTTPGGNDPDEAPPPPDVPAAGFAVRSADVSNCPELPLDRKEHSAAWVQLAQPVPLADGWFERGFLVYGGRNVNDPLDDLWLFDVGNDRPTNSGLTTTAECPWHQLSADFTSDLGAWDGQMVYNDNTEDVTILPGNVKTPSGQYTTPNVYALDISEAIARYNAGIAVTANNDAFVYTAPSSPYTFENIGEDFCGEAYTGACITVDPGSLLQCYSDCVEDPLACNSCNIECELFIGPYTAMEKSNGEPFTGCDMSNTNDRVVANAGVDVSYRLTCEQNTGASPLTELFGPLVPGCAADPICTNNATATVSTPGAAGQAAWFHRSSGVVYEFGGATGCTGSSCASWDGMFTAAADDPTLYAANRPDGLTHGAVVNQFEIDLFSVTPAEDEWTAGSFGIRGASAALGGQVWDSDSRSMTATTGSPMYVVGGTVNQALAPGRQHLLDCEFTSPCGYCDTWLDGGYAPAVEALVFSAR